MKKRIRFRLLAATTLLLGGAACTVAPPDVPPIDVPDGYIMATRGDTLVVEGLEWWEIFGDTTLSRLIVTALENNRNLAATAATVEAARQNLASVRGSLAPAIDLGAEGSATYTTPSTGGKKRVEQSYSLLPRVSWEVALFGIAASSDAAREEWVATEWGYRATRLALEAQVAETYFQWLQYARQLEISERSYQLRLEAQQKSDSLFYYGYTSGTDLQQAHSLTAAAAADIPSYRRAMVQTNLILNTLLGGEPELLAMPTHSRECEHSVGAQLDGLSRLPHSPSLSPADSPRSSWSDDPMLWRPTTRPKRQPPPCVWPVPPACPPSHSQPREVWPLQPSRGLQKAIPAIGRLPSRSVSHSSISVSCVPKKKRLLRGGEVPF